MFQTQDSEFRFEGNLLRLGKIGFVLHRHHCEYKSCDFQASSQEPECLPSIDKLNN